MALALFGMVVGVRYKCRGEQHYAGRNGMLGEAEEEARLIEHHADLAAETAHLRELLSDRGERTT